MALPLKNQERDHLRALKGAAIYLLLIVRMDPRPMGETEISEILDVHPQTARKYLRRLSDMNLIARAGRYSSYRLTAGGRQLVLPNPAEMLPDVGNAKKSRSTAKNDSNEREKIALPPAYLLTYLLNPRRLKNDLNSNSNKVSNKKGVGSAKKSRSTAKNDSNEGEKIALPGSSVKKSRSPKTCAALEAAGIFENQRTRPLFESDIHPDVITRLESDLKDRKGNDYQPGLLVHVLLGLPKEKYHPDGCSCWSCLRRYSSWENFND